MLSWFPCGPSEGLPNYRCGSSTVNKNICFYHSAIWCSELMAYQRQDPVSVQNWGDSSYWRWIILQHGVMTAMTTVTPTLFFFLLHSLVKRPLLRQGKHWLDFLTLSTVLSKRVGHSGTLNPPCQLWHFSFMLLWRLAAWIPCPPLLKSFLAPLCLSLKSGCSVGM